MALGETTGSWLTLFVLVLGPGIVATVLWSPVLASSRVRSLFRHVPPTDSTVGNYLLAAMGLSLPWVVGFGWAFSVIGARLDSGTPQAPQAEPIFLAAMVLFAGYVVGLPLLAGLGLPRLGIDWDENGYGPSTWVVLVLTSAWYAAIYTIPAFVTGIIVELPA